MCARNLTLFTAVHDAMSSRYAESSSVPVSDRTPVIGFCIRPGVENIDVARNNQVNVQKLPPSPPMAMPR